MDEIRDEAGYVVPDSIADELKLIMTALKG